MPLIFYPALIHEILLIFFTNSLYINGFVLGYHVDFDQFYISSLTIICMHDCFCSYAHNVYFDILVQPLRFNVAIKLILPPCFFEMVKQ